MTSLKDGDQLLKSFENCDVNLSDFVIYPVLSNLNDANTQKTLKGLKSYKQRWSTISKDEKAQKVLKGCSLRALS